MKHKFLISFFALLLLSCSTENEKADNSVLGIWKITKAFQGNQTATDERALVGCEQFWRYAFGTDYFFNEAALTAEVPCQLLAENTYRWSETAVNAYECRRVSDNELRFTAIIYNGIMTMYRPDIDTTFLLRHTTN